MDLTQNRLIYEPMRQAMIVKHLMENHGRKSALGAPSDTLTNPPSAIYNKVIVEWFHKYRRFNFTASALGSLCLIALVSGCTSKAIIGSHSSGLDSDTSLVARMANTLKTELTATGLSDSYSTRIAEGARSGALTASSAIRLAKATAAQADTVESVAPNLLTGATGALAKSIELNAGWRIKIIGAILSGIDAGIIEHGTGTEDVETLQGALVKRSVETLADVFSISDFSNLESAVSKVMSTAISTGASKLGIASSKQSSFIRTIQGKIVGHERPRTHHQ